MKHHHLFMYGSNLNPQRLQNRASQWNGQGTVATLIEHELRFNKKSRSNSTKSAANICVHNRRCVWGVIVQLSPKDLAKMDKYEGLPDHYQRKDVSLVLTDGSVAQAQTYIAQPAM